MPGKDDGSLNLRGEVTPLMRLLLRRRSVRRYAGPARDEDAAAVLEAAARFQERAGFTAPRLVAVRRGDGFESVVRAAMTGAVGLVNPWLSRTEASHLILCGAVYPRSGDERGVERALKEAAMTMQVAVLAAAERDLATCWMAGIHHERIEAATPLLGDARLIAISPLGLAPARAGLSWDGLMHQLVSKRRKPLEALLHDERWREP